MHPPFCVSVKLLKRGRGLAFYRLAPCLNMAICTENIVFCLHVQCAFLVVNFLSQPRTQVFSSPERMTLVGSGHVIHQILGGNKYTNRTRAFVLTKTEYFPLCTWLNKNKNQSKAHLPHLFYLSPPRIWVPRDQIQPGSFSRERKEPGYEFLSLFS